MSSSLKSSNINSESSHSYIGVDVAKDKLDFFIYDKNQFFTISNNKTSINQFIKSHIKDLDKPLIVCETTGGWERIMLVCLVENNINSHLAHASKIYYFAKSKGILAKTDKLDAKIITLFSISEKLEPSSIADEESIELKDLVMRKIQLKRTISTEKRRQRKYLSKNVQKSLDKSILFCQKEIVTLDKQINKIFDTKESYIKANKILRSMIGVGDTTAQTLIVLLPELGKVNKRQIAALAGVAPYNNDSGKRNGRMRIRGGRIEIRNALYMACLSSIRYNKVMKEYYERLVEKGKIKKIALIAVMRKMLVILNSLMANKVYFEVRS